MVDTTSVRKCLGTLISIPKCMTMLATLGILGGALHNAVLGRATGTTDIADLSFQTSWLGRVRAAVYDEAWQI